MSKPARKIYSVTLKSNSKEDIYCDTVTITQNGDACFQTWVEMPGVKDPETGDQGYEPNVARVIPSGAWLNIEQIVAGTPLWKQTGTIALASGAQKRILAGNA